MKNTFRVFALVSASVWASAITSAQTFEEYKRRQHAKYNTYAQKKAEEYRAYRDRVNAEYADYMRRAWTCEEAQPAKPLPKRPEPPKPVVRNPMEMPKFDAIPFGEVQDIPIPKVTPSTPVVPIDILEMPVPMANPTADSALKPVKQPEEKSKKVGLWFSCFGQEWNVPLEELHRFRLRSVNEGDVADVWKALSGTKYMPVVAACLKVRAAHQLPDWGYLYFLECLARAFLPGLENEALLLTMFVLVQSGYQVRIARADGHLFLLVPSSGDIYEYPYLNIGGRKYYVIGTGKGKGTQSLYVFERDFPKEQPFVWYMDRQPLLAGTKQSRTLQSKRHPEARAVVNTCSGLMELYEHYPRCNDWNLYVLSSLSKEAKESLYPALRQSMKGNTTTEAVDVLLGFVQTAFEYKTDGEQFGAERPLFGDETLYYPYSDCEDRAILFSILVRDLLGLDVVMLNYPDHLATAVRLGDDATGDYLELDGHRYVVCDPTFIGSHVGESMPEYKRQQATIIRI